MSNFWQALEQVNQQNQLAKKDLKKIEYRLYYNEETGEPLFYSMSEEDGCFIVIDHKTYSFSRYDIKVKNGEIIDIPANEVRKYKPSNAGTACHATNIMIIDPESSFYWRF